MKILVVDDDFICRKVLSRILDGYGDLDIASDGDEAICAVEMAISEEDPYDLICLDLCMPKLPGLDALKEIRSIEHSAGIKLGTGAKVIITTSLKDSSNLMAAFRAGCESYITKPLSKTKILEELVRLKLVTAS
ncbi:MAG: response regulator [Candidatus Cloacimonetes bacterium]|nr:response regulator [Candidatus Cloacimonadota bacterium]